MLFFNDASPGGCKFERKLRAIHSIAQDKYRRLSTFAANDMGLAGEWAPGILYLSIDERKNMH
jgi:hypothetical protein